jgi:hypothetical protein
MTLGSILKSTVKDLKREYGRPIVLTRRVVGDQDLSTGETPVTETKINIRKAIRLEKKQTSLFVNLGGATLKKNVDVSSRQFLVDGADVPFEPDSGDELIADGVTYVVKDVVALDLNIGYVITVEVMS